jgi:HEAT repeat protein
MDNSDRDIRIFAINILGDIKCEASIELLRSFIATENDINALMTAVDYLGEIGDERDTSLLKTIKQAHEDEPYVVFGVDLALSRLKEPS